MRPCRGTWAPGGQTRWRPFGIAALTETGGDSDLVTGERLRRRRRHTGYQRVVGWLIAGVLIGGLSGCGRYYWSKSGSTAEQFSKDSLECAREASPTPAAQQRGIVVDTLYRACLTARGYTRGKQYDPSPDSYRGIE